MVEKLKKLGNRILEWWKKFDTKKKIALISAVAVVVLTLVILGMVLTRNYHGRFDYNVKAQQKLRKSKTYLILPA